jgi:copper homeostasis protein
MRDFLVEVCCGSTEDALQAAKGGADRVELCSNLFQGGLTPTLGSFRTIKRNSDIKVNVMIRPREGGFLYTEKEWETALEDARIFAAEGADGLVCGMLNEDGTVDMERTKQIVEIAGDIPVTFHRAIDVVPDWKEAIDQLVACGVKKILTSGQNANVLLGLDTVKEMVDYAGDRLVVMPGAGITPDTAMEVAKRTGCTEMHVYFVKTYQDFSTKNNRSIFFGSALYPSETTYPVIDADQLKQIR